MAKKKRADKDNDEKKAKETRAPKQADDFSTVRLPPEMFRSAFLKPDAVYGSLSLTPETISNIFSKPDMFYGSISLPPETISSAFLKPDAVYGSLSLTPETISSAFLKPDTFYGALSLPTETTSREQELEDEIANLKKEKWQLLEEIATKTETEQEKKRVIKDLEKKIEQLNKKQRLQHLLCRVSEAAKKKLLESEDFRNLFEKTEYCSAVIISIDIRRSTELMLRAREPKLYADFITSLCADLTRIILNHYGVFDKFTGDGILAFFPDFFSGLDAPYLAMKAADECHTCFSKHYRGKRSCFRSVLMDVGLGIGIDYGESHLVKIQDGITVIGEPVVYACRMSGAKAGQTLLNQPAYEVTSRKFGEYINFQESEIDIKHEGKTLAYAAILSKKTYEPKLPDWLNTPPSTQ